VVILVFVEGHTVPLGFQLIKLAKHRWSWGGLMSPSAYICFSTIIASVLVPIQGAFMAIGLLSSKEPTVARHRYLSASLCVIGIAVLPFVTDTILWGTFPFTFDEAGIGRLRLIPFIPWPDAPYGTF
jgi:hypothetical protein